MATYKIDVKLQFGKYQAAFWKIGDSAPKFSDFDDVNGVSDYLIDSCETVNFGDDDDVHFRQIAYSDISSLAWEIKRANY